MADFILKLLKNRESKDMWKKIETAFRETAVWWDYDETKPSEYGWYPVLYTFESNASYNPGAGYWGGESFDSSPPISHFINRKFESSEEAKAFAHYNDPNF